VTTAKTDEEGRAFSNTWHAFRAAISRGLTNGSCVSIREAQSPPQVFRSATAVVARCGGRARGYYRKFDFAVSVSASLHCAGEVPGVIKLAGDLMMTDPIADMLTRNPQWRPRAARRVEMPHSRLKEHLDRCSSPKLLDDVRVSDPTTPTPSVP